MDADTLDKAVAISYDDFNLDSIRLDLSIINSSKVYYYSLSNYSYQSDKNTYTDIVSCLLLSSTNIYLLEDNASLGALSIDSDVQITTDKSKSKYIVSKNSPDGIYLSGSYETNNNEFFYYQKALIITGTNTFSGAPDFKVKPNDTLHNCYRGLLVA